MNDFLIDCKGCGSSVWDVVAQCWDVVAQFGMW
jgi:hypothetical protein